MNLATDEVERMAHDLDGVRYHQTAAALRALAAERDELQAESQKLAAFSHAYLSDYQEARGEIEKLRKAILEALKLADLDAIKSFRKTLLMALGEKE